MYLHYLHLQALALFLVFLNFATFSQITFNEKYFLIRSHIHETAGDRGNGDMNNVVS